ncbi:MAG: phosphoribosylanthranilate isomerase, partial [Lachnospiraceae bacterium]|nr:phosphoribosylanthranilate isomerase [Lachnospiraceae bacterium]
MTKIKLCGLSRCEDIEAVNELKPDYIGFVFASWSKRYVSPEKAGELKALLDPGIKAAGVFVDEKPDRIAKLLESCTIDIAQLHGSEDEEYIKGLRELTDKPLIKAFKISEKKDIRAAEESSADYVLLDSGTGTGNVFDWELLKG